MDNVVLSVTRLPKRKIVNMKKKKEKNWRRKNFVEKFSITLFFFDNEPIDITTLIYARSVI